MDFQNILVICVGNICRSPMAEALLKQAFPHKNIISAGLEGLAGYSADPMAIECMREIGVDISTHVAQKLNADMLVKADLVLAMTTQQVQIVETCWGFSKGRVFRFCHWSDKNIADPYRKEKSAFISSRDLIQEGVRDWNRYF